MSIRRGLPVSLIPTLRSLYMLTPHTYDDRYNFENVDFPMARGKSNMTTLVFDEAKLTPSHEIAALQIPKKLEYFHWSQEEACFSFRTYYASFYHQIGQGLMAHRETRNTSILIYATSMPAIHLQKWRRCYLSTETHQKQLCMLPKSTS